MLAEVPAVFAEIGELADKHGYIACLFGSTVKRGDGRDLDVMMLSRFGERQCWREFLAAFGGTVVKQYHREPVERGNHSYEVERAGKLYHFVFGRF